MDMDAILVMSKGKAVEGGTPYTLLQDPASALSGLVDSTGGEAPALRKMALAQHQLCGDTQASCISLMGADNIKKKSAHLFTVDI